MTQEHQWLSAEPEQVRHWLRALAARWWIAGGWAIDLALERVTRAHEDVDVGILRRDVPALRASLSDWQFFAARGGQLTELGHDESPSIDAHSVWCRPRGSVLWHLEVLLEMGDGVEWIYRRNPEIHRLWMDVLARSACGLPFLKPEVQLLYKSKHPRERDDEDLAVTLPALSYSARQWLRSAIAASHPNENWLAALGT
jgi:hypothetical protein